MRIKTFFRGTCLMLSLLLLHSTLFACSGQLATPTSITSGSVAIDPANQGEINSIAFSPNGDLLAANASDGIGIWRVATGERVYTLPADSKVLVWDIANDRPISGDRDNAVRIWQMGSKQPMAVLSGHQPAQGTAAEGGSGIIALTVSPDGAWIASAGHDKQVFLWSSKTGKQVLALPRFSDLVTAVAFSPDGTQLATAGLEQPVVLWDSQTGKEILRLNTDADSIYALVFSLDGRWLATGGKEGIVRVWDVTTGALNQTLNVGQWIYSMVYSPDGKTIATGDQSGQVLLWDIFSGQVQQTMSGSSTPVYAVAFSTDGHLLTSAGKGETIRLWDPRTGAMIKMIKSF